MTAWIRAVRLNLSAFSIFALCLTNNLTISRSPIEAIQKKCKFYLSTNSKILRKSNQPANISGVNLSQLEFRGLSTCAPSSSNISVASKCPSLTEKWIGQWDDFWGRLIPANPNLSPKSPKSSDEDRALSWSYKYLMFFDLPLMAAIIIGVTPCLSTGLRWPPWLAMKSKQDVDSFTAA